MRLIGVSALAAAAMCLVRDLRHGTHGQVARVRSRIGREPPGDHQLRESIRARFHGLSRHPGAIEVRVDGGCVTLRGPVLADEVDRLLYTVAAQGGVTEIDNQLAVHGEPGTVPALQSRPARPGGGHVLPWTQTHWSPAARFLASVAGAGVALAGVRWGGRTGATLALGGLGLLLRGATNLETKRLAGLGAGRRAVTVHKTVTLAAPVERVFDFWSHDENVPRFMSHVREVRRTGLDRAHWVVSGPAGVPVEFDTEVTARVPNRVLAWRTLPGSVVDRAGIVRFDAVPGGGTRVHVRLAYNLPAGASGHAAASLLGSDPERVMDEDLARLPSLLENGRTTDGKPAEPRGLAG